MTDSELTCPVTQEASDLRPLKRETMEDYVAVIKTKKDGLPDEKEIYHLHCFDEYFEEIKIERKDERGTVYLLFPDTSHYKTLTLADLEKFALKEAICSRCDKPIVELLENNKWEKEIHATAATPIERFAPETISERVKVTRIKGPSLKGFPASFVGYQESPPEIGRPYRVITEQGWHFRTSIVREVGDGYIKTQNSEYRIELLDEE
jgi:hypothetical protein